MTTSTAKTATHITTMDCVSHACGRIVKLIVLFEFVIKECTICNKNTIQTLGPSSYQSLASQSQQAWEAEFTTRV